MPKTVRLVNDDWKGLVEKTRHACRGILVRDGDLLLGYLSKEDKYMLPGGGVENEETPAECCEREMLEETGIRCKAVLNYLDIDELYDVWRHVNHYFVCEMTEDTGKTNLTQAETAGGYTAVWVPLNEALALFGGYGRRREKDPALYGLYRREYTALKAYADAIVTSRQGRPQ